MGAAHFGRFLEMRPWRNQIHHGDCLELMSQMPAALATRPLFVFVMATALSGVRWQLLDESLTPRALEIKGISILLIVGALSLG